VPGVLAGYFDPVAAAGREEIRHQDGANR